MRPILAGLDTETGIWVEGRGAEDLIDDSKALVRSTPDECLAVWDLRYEAPRADLRGFRLDRLAFDPEDAKFDHGREHGRPEDVRSDRVLPTGARFYNDHGHPEFATPECWTLDDLALHDAVGMGVVLRAAKAFSQREEREVRIYKNNTDFHGASYGTHESYLVPRELGYERLYAAVTPILVARTVLTGAGKAGSESGEKVAFQLSQRADFFMEPANAETLYRRPVFNTRDEPHADPREWIRLHMISGDANMSPTATKLKVGLVKLAIALAEAKIPPSFKIPDPVKAFQAVSRGEAEGFRISLGGSNWTSAPQILEDLCCQAEAELELDADGTWTVQMTRRLLASLSGDPTFFRRHVDWAAKKHLLQSLVDDGAAAWGDPALLAYDLEYTNVDPEEGLWFALAEMGEVEPGPSVETLEAARTQPPTGSRALARGLAVSRFPQHVRTLSWGALTLSVDGRVEEVPLPPDRRYPAQLADTSDVGTFISLLRDLR